MLIHQLYPMIEHADIDVAHFFHFFDEDFDVSGSQPFSCKGEVARNRQPLDHAKQHLIRVFFAASTKINNHELKALIAILNNFKKENLTSSKANIYTCPGPTSIQPIPPPPADCFSTMTETPVSLSQSVDGCTA